MPPNPTPLPPATRTAPVATHLHPQNSAARAALAEDNFNLEGRIMGELKQMEEESARINSQIEEVRGGAGGWGAKAAGRQGTWTGNCQPAARGAGERGERCRRYGLHARC